MSTFDAIEAAPPDPILGLTEAFRADPNPEKINLGVGVYQDDTGRTPVLASVKEAERRILEGETTKSYLPIGGDAAYGEAVRGLLFDVAPSGAATAHTPGGTGGLRVAFELLRRLRPEASVWLSDPTWANHPQILQAVGLEPRTYRYLTEGGRSLDLDGMLEDLSGVPRGDAVLLHACCHNPSGVDPDAAAWQRIAAVLVERELLPVIDFAYQGFGDGLEEDAAGLREVVRARGEALVASSFSKNFGLYRERVGAVTVVAATPAIARSVESHVKAVARTSYSNPPAHGAAIVTTILGDEALRAEWRAELDGMRERIHRMRRSFVARLAARGVAADFSFLERQRGMFSFSGLTPEQVDRLRERHSIYAVRSGRINVAGMTEANLDRLCDAIAEVLASA